MLNLKTMGDYSCNVNPESRAERVSWFVGESDEGSERHFDSAKTGPAAKAPRPGAVPADCVLCDTGRVRCPDGSCRSARWIGIGGGPPDVAVGADETKRGASLL